MNFYSLAMKNIKKNFENYIAYFISTVASVMVFYIFVSLFLNKQIRAFSEISKEIMVLFQPSAVLVAVFTCVFLWHSTSFFLKSRKKELATYILLGMSKAQIGKMLLIENLLMRTIALFIGISLGTLFSKLFTLILVSLMSSVIDVQFTILWNAVLFTIIAFYIVFFVDSVHAYFIIYNYRLIELFNVQNKKGIAWKMPLVSLLFALLFIGCTYTIAIKNAIDIKVMLRAYAIPILFTVVAGTYILFNNIVILLVRLLKKNKRYYYNRINLLVTSQILYKIRNNAAMLATIATLSAATITAVGVAYVYYETTDLIIDEVAPLSFMHISDNREVNDKVLNIIKKHPENKLVGYSDFTLLEASAELNIKKRPMMLKNYTFKTKVIPLSQYNSALRLLGITSELKQLGDNECYLGKLEMLAKSDEYLIGREMTILQPYGNRQLSVAGSTIKNVLNYNVMENFIVVADDTFNELLDKAPKVESARGYIVRNQGDSKALSEELREILPQIMDLGSFYEIHTILHGISGVIIFIGIFTGITFILATGSIIYYKQLIEANEDKRKYATLRKIGVSLRDIRLAISRQLLVIFGMPLIIGICHSIVALCTLQLTVKQNIMQYGIVVILIYIAIYAMFYILTLNSYIKTVSE